MTDTEDALQSYLDSHDDDHICRLALADLLEEAGDGRAMGYRALGALRLVADNHNSYDPKFSPNEWYWGRAFNINAHEWRLKSSPTYLCLLPDDWWDLVVEKPSLNNNGWWKHFPTRRDAEDAAALAFLRLPPERQAELLSREVTHV